MSEQLKPCPFCGKIPKINGGDFKNRPLDSCLGSGPIHIEEWNNAYCWKQVQSLEQRIKDLEEALEKITNTVPGETMDWDIFRRIA